VPQLHVYVSEAVARETRRHAEAEGLSVSRYLARLLERKLGPGWPEGYFDRVVGAWRGVPLERAPQGEPEGRDAIELPLAATDSRSE
jgi:hypothetical protein